MYHQYFGIEEQAFSIAVNPRYMYMSAQHREALAHLLYGVKSGGFVMLTGEVGTGKTTTIRCLLEQLPEAADVAMILNPAANARDLMCSICDEFGITYDPEETSTKVLTDKLHEFLLGNHGRERNSIVLIDEAQLLRVSTLEQIRLLTNLESNTQKMLQIILVGQPELNELLAKPALRQLSQRITARYHLRPLTFEETGTYIRHRLKVAGLPPGRDPFPTAVVKKIHATSGGIPRLINIMCDRMLLGAYTQEAVTVDKAICKQATQEVLGDPRLKQAPAASGSAAPYIYAGSAIVIALIFAALVWLILGQNSSEATQTVSEVVAEEKASEPAVAPPPAVKAQTEVYPYVVPSQNDALTSLLDYFGIRDETAVYPCWLASKKDLYCETLEAATWDEFLAINRPAVLSLRMPSRHSAYATVLSVLGNMATVSHRGQTEQVSLNELGKLWTGEYIVIWARPDLFEKAIGRGFTGPMVNWLAAQFAELDGQTTRLAKDTYNARLENRVKLFQRQYGLEDDGLVGMQTLLRLGEALGREVPLRPITSGFQSDDSDAAPAPEAEPTPQALPVPELISDSPPVALNIAPPGISNVAVEG